MKATMANSLLICAASALSLLLLVAQPSAGAPARSNSALLADPAYRQLLLAELSQEASNEPAAGVSDEERLAELLAILRNLRHSMPVVVPAEPAAKRGGGSNLPLSSNWREGTKRNELFQLRFG